MESTVEIKEKKRIVFYTLLSVGHTNLSLWLSRAILDRYSKYFEIAFIVDDYWEDRLSKLESRIKFLVINYENKQETYRDDQQIEYFKMIAKLELADRMTTIWDAFKYRIELLIKTEKKVYDLLVNYKPDFIFIDQIFLMPSVIKSKIPFSYICSVNPLVFDFKEDFPYLGDDSGMDEKNKIAQFRSKLNEKRNEFLEFQKKIFNSLEVNFPENENLHTPKTNDFTFYTFPKELDYYSDEIKNEFKLIQLDSPLIPEYLPAPYKLPENWLKKPGKVVYVSLGSNFGAFTDYLERLIDILKTLPYKYIFSKGPNGEKIKFPNDNFIGENFIDQLAVLQSVDLVISHGGTNTIGECFYFGVPCIILCVYVDQINNGKRIEELGYGIYYDMSSYTDSQLINAIEKMINDDEIRQKWREASQNTGKNFKIGDAADYVFNYLINKND